MLQHHLAAAPHSKSSAARSTTRSAIASDAVAAGLGALRTCNVVFSNWRRSKMKSYARMLINIVRLHRYWHTSTRRKIGDAR